MDLNIRALSVLAVYSLGVAMQGSLDLGAADFAHALVW